MEIGKKAGGTGNADVGAMGAYLKHTVVVFLVKTLVL